LNLTLRRADDALILGHRLSQWCGHAPIVEEDIALANIALDLIGQSRALYDYAAQVDSSGLTEDHFAYRREQHQYRNCLLVEQPNGDFATTIVRQVLFSAFMDLYWREMMKSGDESLAAIAAKAEKETAYHLRQSASATVPTKATRGRKPRSMSCGFVRASCSRATRLSAR
jgi:ring-1,2-phenylacetyl-CoA epoxidase subunit PaaC